MVGLSVDFGREESDRLLLKDKLARKYKGKSNRKIFGEDYLWKEPRKVLEEYPVI